MRARPDLAAGGRITIVEDFLTKGNTLLGAASRLAEVYPQAVITVLALVRTMGYSRKSIVWISPASVAPGTSRGARFASRKLAWRQRTLRSFRGLSEFPERPASLGRMDSRLN